MKLIKVKKADVSIVSATKLKKIKVAIGQNLQEAAKIYKEEINHSNISPDQKNKLQGEYSNLVKLGNEIVKLLNV